MIKLFPNGSKAYINFDGFLHRINGPANIYYSNNEEEKFWHISWYVNGILHREDGPAIENSRGHKEYWYYGNRIDVESTEDFIRYIKLLAFI